MNAQPSCAIRSKSPKRMDELFERREETGEVSVAMKLSDLATGAGEWLRGSGPMSEIVISSRIRLARNLANHRFLSKCTRHQRQTIEHKTRDIVLSANLAPQVLYVDLEQAP